jgi:hypothetical protein
LSKPWSNLFGPTGTAGRPARGDRLTERPGSVE